MVEALYTPAEVAEKCKVNVHTVLKWLRAGTLKGIKMAQHWRITDSDLQAYIDGLKAAGSTRPE